MSFSSNITHDGHKNAVVQVVGSAIGDGLFRETILDIQNLKGGHRAIRIDDVVYAIQGKLTCLLWWKDKEGDSLMFPLEGRGKLDFSALEGLQHGNRANWAGKILLTTANVLEDQELHFMFMLNLTKQL